MCFSKTDRVRALTGLKSFDIDNVNVCDYEELMKNITRSSNDFTIIQQNIRGINSKIGDIKYLIDNTYATGHPDCILLCETWLGPCRGITQIHRSPSRPRPTVRPTAVLINIHEHLIKGPVEPSRQTVN